MQCYINNKNLTHLRKGSEDEGCGFISIIKNDSFTQRILSA